MPRYTFIEWDGAKLTRASDLIREHGLTKAAKLLTEEWKTPVKAATLTHALALTRGNKPADSPVWPARYVSDAEANESTEIDFNDVLADEVALAYDPTEGKPKYEPTEGCKVTEAESFQEVIIPDTHVPAHHVRAWNCALGIVKELQPKKGKLIGDFGNMESLSRHPKTRPDLNRYKSEVYAMNVALDQLQNASPNTEWVYLQGNHEMWSEKFVNMYGTMDGLLDLPAQLYITRGENYHRNTGKLRGMKWVPLIQQPYIEPYAASFHGEPLTSKYFTAVIADTYAPGKGHGLPTFSGHMHTFQSYQSKIKGYSQCVGFLGDESRIEFQAYVEGKPTGWQLGIVVLEVAPDNTVTYSPIHITNTGKALFNGKLFCGQ